MEQENRVIRERLQALRKAMKAEGIDFYMMPTADFHNSEYVNDYFKVREYFCNFSGSNGTLLVWQDGAGLWTDGRDFIQAERELAGTGVTLFRMLDEGVPTMKEFLQKEMKEGQTFGFDGRVISAGDGKRYEKALTDKKIKFVYDKDLAETIWTDRPAFPGGKVMVLDEEIAGMRFEDKWKRVMEKVEKEGAESFLLTKLDDLMWLFNIRGCDVECNPVAMSYGYFTNEKAVLFIQKCALDRKVTEYLESKGILVEAYADVAEFLKNIPSKDKILVDSRHCSYYLYKILASNQTIVEKQNPTEELKAVKNSVELANMEKIYLKDSVAVTKFIYWLKNAMKSDKDKRVLDKKQPLVREAAEEQGALAGQETMGEITEVSAAEYLEKLRRAIPEFLDLSFPTIAGYKENAAMMHYEATPENCAVLGPEGLLLVDSGGQYLGGTTDVTRTIVLGPISDEIKLHYTMVAVGMLRLSAARWLHGCTGRNLDILARQPLWNMGLDYKCGTGHGVGYILNVHEGPQGLRWRYMEGAAEAVLEAGMDVTNEPGVYVEGSHGIRIENVMVAENDVKNEYGQFMHFKTLTWVPIDMEAIDEKYLTQTDKMLLYYYQKKVYNKISPYLTEEEAAWLRAETRADNTVILGQSEAVDCFA